MAVFSFSSALVNGKQKKHKSYVGRHTVNSNSVIDHTLGFATFVMSVLVRDC